MSRPNPRAQMETMRLHKCRTAQALGDRRGISEVPSKSRRPRENFDGQYASVLTLHEKAPPSLAGRGVSGHGRTRLVGILRIGGNLGDKLPGGLCPINEAHILQSQREIGLKGDV